MVPSAARVIVQPRRSITTGSSARTRAASAVEVPLLGGEHLARPCPQRRRDRRRSVARAPRGAGRRRAARRRPPHVEPFLGAADGGVGAPGDAVGAVAERCSAPSMPVAGDRSTTAADRHARRSAEVLAAAAGRACWAHAVGVLNELWATSSATLRSTSWPRPVSTGTAIAAMAMAIASLSKTASSLRAPPPRMTTIGVERAASERGDRARRPSPRPDRPGRARRTTDSSEARRRCRPARARSRATPRCRRW